MIISNYRPILPIKIVLHHCCICALCKLPTLLNPTLIENTCHCQFTNILAIVGLIDTLTRHGESLNGRFGKLIFNLFLELNQLKFYLRIDVSLLFEWPTSKSDNISLTCPLFLLSILSISISDSLWYTLHVIWLCKSVLSTVLLILLIMIYLVVKLVWSHDRLFYLCHWLTIWGWNWGHIVTGRTLAVNLRSWGSIRDVVGWQIFRIDIRQSNTAGDLFNLARRSLIDYVILIM